MSIEKDLELLDKILEIDISDELKEKFDDMRYNITHFGKSLSPAQREWADSVLEGKKYEAEEKYENLISSGKVSKKSTVELLVKDHPLKPPVKKSDI